MTPLSESIILASLAGLSYSFLQGSHLRFLVSIRVTVHDWRQLFHVFDTQKLSQVVQIVVTGTTLALSNFAFRCASEAGFMLLAISYGTLVIKVQIHIVTLSVIWIGPSGKLLAQVEWEIALLSLWGQLLLASNLAQVNWAICASLPSC